VWQANTGTLSPAEQFIGPDSEYIWKFLLVSEKHLCQLAYES
jgi:hypothetical protein